jgi:hypothetical protein
MSISEDYLAEVEDVLLVKYEDKIQSRRNPLYYSH